MKINEIINELRDDPNAGKKLTKREQADREWMARLQKSATWMGPNSKTWDPESFELAVKMYKKGYNPKEIWAITQNIMGTDGHWRQEIDDSEAKFIKNAKGNTMGDQLYHPELYKAYPGIAKTPFDANWDNTDSGAGGMVKNGKISLGIYYADYKTLLPTDARLNTAAHEWGHVVQDKFEPQFDGGGNDGSDLSLKVAKANNITKKQAYLGKGGEHMTVGAEDRRKLSKAERAATYPDLTKGALGDPAPRITITKTHKVPPFDFNDPNKDRNAIKGNSSTNAFIFPTKHVTFDNPHITDQYDDVTADDILRIKKELNIPVPAAQKKTSLAVPRNSPTPQIRPSNLKMPNQKQKFSTIPGGPPINKSGSNKQIKTIKQKQTDKIDSLPPSERLGNNK